MLLRPSLHCLAGITLSKVSFFLFKIFVVVVLNHTHVWGHVHMGLPLPMEATRVWWIPGTVVSMPDVDIRNKSQVLYKSSEHS